MKLKAEAACVLILGLCATRLSAQPDTSPMEAMEPAIQTGSAVAELASDGALTSEHAAASYLDTVAVQVPTGAATEAQKPIVRSRLIEEIIVTAQKREENLQDVPISITAFSAEALEARGVGQASDLPRITPGLQYDIIGGFSLVYLRGVGSDAFVSGDPSVATYVDDIYLPQNHGSSQAFGAVQRIEVLKGPQGTLFGRNATGGAINVITPEPEDSFDGSVQVATETYDRLKSNVYLTGPLVDGLAGSLAVVYNVGGKNYFDPTPESPVQNFIHGEEKGIRAKLLWKPFDRFEASLAGLQYRARASRYNVFVLEESSPALGPALALAGVRPDEGDPYEVGQSTEPFNYTYNDLAYTKLKYATDWFDIKLSGSYQDTYTNVQIDFDGSSGDVAFVHAPRQDSLVRTYELQFVSNDTSWAADRFRWIVGLYRFESTQGVNPVYVGALQNTVSIPALADLLDGAVPEDVTIVAGSEQVTRSTAAFFQATYDLIDTLSLTLGGRYQDESREHSASGAGLLNSDMSVTSLTQFPPARISNTNFAPKAVLDWKPNEASLLYLSYSKAFKSGTFNLVDIAFQLDPVLPEEVSAIELGAKLGLFDHRVQLNAAIFQNKIQNLQTQFIGLTSGGIVSLENATSAEIRGGDVDLLWSITPALVLTANAAVLDSKFGSYQGGTGFDETTGLFRRNFDFTGNRIPHTPKFSGTVGLAYTRNIGNGVAEVGGDVYYNSGYYYDNQNSLDTDAYTLFNARMSYLYEPWKLRATVFGINLTNEVYHIGRFAYDLGALGTLAAPATYGVRLQWDF